MTKPKVFEKPSGVKDYLPHAVAKLRTIESHVLDCMQGWGYEQIITPSMEYYDTVGMASATSDQKLFKLLNNRGTTLVLRSDMTAPIARVASSLLKEQPFPLRLSYHANVFRAIEEEAGREAEFFQTGVELIGDASAEADAEVVALAIASLQAAGVQRFKIAIGHVAFLSGLFEESLAGQQQVQEQLKSCLLNRDYVGYRELLAGIDAGEDVRRKLEAILRLRGGKEICEQALELSAHPDAQAAINHLREIWDVLQAYGVCEHVMVDLTMIGDFSYYTGMTFEGYAADLGFPVVNGGRYDNLLAQFGRPAPATGFALKTTRILELVADEEGTAGRQLFIGYDAEGRARALEEARQARAAGWIAVTERLYAVADVPGLQEASTGGYALQYKGKAYERAMACFGEDGTGGQQGGEVE